MLMAQLVVLEAAEAEVFITADHTADHVNLVMEAVKVLITDKTDFQLHEVDQVELILVQEAVAASGDTQAVMALLL
jgi:hypothetical protein|tara:strand:- start:130 stop:357 length:228 start_codon:yes stop_codon:yes gene_type:complete